MAATDADMRMDMNVEDEYFSIIEMRDTEIMQKTRELAEKNAEIKQANAKVEQANAKVEQANAKAAEANAKAAEANAEKNRMLKKTVEALLNAGVEPEDISKTLGIDIKDIVP